MNTLHNDIKYQTLTNILDELCKEAPRSKAIYYPRPGTPQVIQARSRAYLHLFLKVKFGLLSYEERESQVTDGSHDGGIDAYHIEPDEKIIYCLQSKFRANAKNFVENQVGADDLVKVELGRILKGEKIDIYGSRYNKSILDFQNRIRKLPDPARYEFKFILLGNAKKLNNEKLKKLCDGFHVEGSVQDSVSFL